MRLYNVIKQTIPAKLYRHVTKRQRRPTLPGGLVTMYDKSKLKDDEKIIMMMAGAKDKKQAEEAMEGYATALDWIRAQPSKHVQWKARFMSWFRRALGVYEYDPLGKLTPPRSNRLKVRYYLDEEGRL
jgi:hypothetical protein